MKLDDRLKELGAQWSVSALINPINIREAEEDTWLRHWKPQYKEIEYDRLICAYNDLLYHIEDYEYTAELRPYYISKIYELLKYLYAFKDRDNNKILDIHGDTPVDLISKHKEELLLISDQVVNYSYPKNTCTAEYAEGYIQAYLDNNHMSYNAERRDMVARCSVSHGKSAVYINSNCTFNHNEIKRLCLHEVDVHIQRRLNGKSKGFLFEGGFDNYTELEEGLAIYNEVQHGYKEGLVRTYLRMCAAHLCIDHTFEDMVTEMYATYPIIDKTTIYNTCFRIKRGLKDFNDYGGYTKDRLYLSGYLKVQDLIEAGASFDAMIADGKTNIEYTLKNINVSR